MNSTEIIKLAGICENYLICPLCCRWGCIFEPPIGAGAEKMGFGITCGSCQKQWCTLCKRAWHLDRSCYEIAFTEKELADEALRTHVIDKMIQDIATRALMHCCSICGCEYIKEEGCNLMTCPKCNGMSCYICSMKLYYKGDTKYWHFTGHDKSDRDATCPLWNNNAGDGKPNQGNSEFNMKIIAKDIINFIASNNRNKIISNLIYSRISKHFEKEKDFIDIINTLSRIQIK
jgi:TRIAD3 protein (E3 ubiquitin-protein ligase RNF216)